MKLEGQVVLCIGGSGGMGRGVAEVALSEGANVIVTSRSLDKAEATAHDLGCQAKQVDISNETSIKRLFERLEHVDHMMITAGTVGRSSFEDTPPSEAPTFMNGKLWATHSCIWYGCHPKVPSP